MTAFTTDMFNTLIQAREALPNTDFLWAKYDMPCCIKSNGRWVKYTHEIPRAPGKIISYRSGNQYIYVDYCGNEYRYTVIPSVKQLLGL